MEIPTENGMDGLAHALEIVFNAAMKIERAEFQGAGPFERTDDRIGRANGFKPRRIQTCAGALDLAIPKVRGLDDGEPGFYPRSLERGVRNERALSLALAEMYVRGVSTRKAMAITEKLCGFEVSSRWTCMRGSRCSCFPIPVSTSRYRCPPGWRPRAEQGVMEAERVPIGRHDRHEGEPCRISRGG